MSLGVKMMSRALAVAIIAVKSRILLQTRKPRLKMRALDFIASIASTLQCIFTPLPGIFLKASNFAQVYEIH